jgi:SAM-dependent methyltransferase
VTSLSLAPHTFPSSRSRAPWRWFPALLLVACLTARVAGAAQAQAPQKDYEPTVGQAGKDVVWVPTPEVVVEKMLDVARITASDFVVDLGSGDGRIVIAAARRGARAHGVEYTPEMVDYSRRAAERAGVGDRATFEQGDMYEAEFSQATALVLFLLPSNLDRLRSRFLDLRPGTRIVINTFLIPEWTPDVTVTTEPPCTEWCDVHLWIVPAKVDGTWRVTGGELRLEQKAQTFSGGLSSGSTTSPVEKGRLRGDEISFVVGASEYTGRVAGDTIEGVVTAGGSSQPWRATRVR